MIFFEILRQTKSLLNSKTIYIKSLLTTFISALHNSLESLQGDPNPNLKFVLAITLNLKINLHLTNTFWLYQHRVKNAYFLVIAKTNFKF